MTARKDPLGELGEYQHERLREMFDEAVESTELSRSALLTKLGSECSLSSNAVRDWIYGPAQYKSEQLPNVLRFFRTHLGLSNLDIMKRLYPE